jgi:hypothetical protein
LGWAESVPRKKAAPQNVLLSQILLASVFDQLFRMEFLSIQFSLPGGTVDKQAIHVRNFICDLRKDKCRRAGFLCHPVDPKRALIFQLFQFFATRLGEIPQRIESVFIDQRTEVGQSLIGFRVLICLAFVICSPSLDAGCRSRKSGGFTSHTSGITFIA